MGFIAPQDLYLHFADIDAVGDLLDPRTQFCCIRFRNWGIGAPGLVWAELSEPRDDIEVDLAIVPGGLGDTAALLAEEQAARDELLAEVDAAFATVVWSQPTSVDNALVLPDPQAAGEELALLIRITATDAAGVRTSDCCLINFAGEAYE